MDKEQKKKFLKRTKLLIFPKFQYKVIAVGMVGLFVSFFFASLFIFLSYKALIQEGLSNGLNLGHPYYKFVDYQYFQLSKKLVVALGAGLAVNYILALYISNKLAGPIYRLETYLKKGKAEGFKNKLSFRKNDYIEHLADLVNYSIFETSSKPPERLPRE